MNGPSTSELRALIAHAAGQPLPRRRRHRSWRERLCAWLERHARRFNPHVWIYPHPDGGIVVQFDTPPPRWSDYERK